jgi:hypothetical protein
MVSLIQSINKTIVQPLFYRAILFPNFINFELIKVEYNHSRIFYRAILFPILFHIYSNKDGVSWQNIIIM